MKIKIYAIIEDKKGYDIMPASKAQQKAVNKYMAINYDRINLTMPKGKKEEIRNHAEQNGESVNSFINRAITETMKRDESK
ncbi:Arc family DNA-binding protein [Thomasclavelia cocleata]|uniref:Arc family DNA-binding protein n=1 Tax=Thomasclavelia cocleata TaxID=69824 RepID=UPI002729D4C8|nr:Arc family DNA-binding protein [Thomasclavelia cocleata]